MKRTILIVATLAAGIATQAPAEPFSFKDGGQLFVGERTRQGDTVVLTGINKTTADRFNYRINKGWVTGTSGSTPVRFHVQDARRTS